MTHKKTLLFFAFLSTNPIFSSQFNRDDYATKKGIDFVFTVGTTQANEYLSELRQRNRIPTPLEKKIDENKEKEGKLTDVQAEYQQSLLDKNEFEFHLLICGNAASNWDPEKKTFKDNECGKAWQEWDIFFKKQRAKRAEKNKQN